MKLLGITAFFLAVLCVCIVGEDAIPTSSVAATLSASTSKSVTETVNIPTPEAVNASSSQATALQASVLRTTTTAKNEFITSYSTSSSPNTIQPITQSTAKQPPVNVTTAATDKSDSTTNTTQESTTQMAQNGSLDASATKGWTTSSPTSLQKTTSAPGTSGLHVNSLTESTRLASDSPRNSTGNKSEPESAVHYSSVILPIVITLIVITLSVFSLVALYRMCQKKTPETQENGNEQAQSDKEGVKLLSVKTTSLETGEHSSQGKIKTRQLFTPQQ
ncbi:endomucin [Podargus strigoides]